MPHMDIALRIFDAIERGMHESDIPCPATKEVPEGGIVVGEVPHHLRGLFVLLHDLRQTSSEHDGENALAIEPIFSAALEAHFPLDRPKCDSGVGPSWEYFYVPDLALESILRAVKNLIGDGESSIEIRYGSPIGGKL